MDFLQIGVVVFAVGAFFWKLSSAIDKIEEKSASRHKQATLEHEALLAAVRDANKEMASAFKEASADGWKRYELLKAAHEKSMDAMDKAEDRHIAAHEKLMDKIRDLGVPPKAGS